MYTKTTDVLNGQGDGVTSKPCLRCNSRRCRRVSGSVLHSVWDLVGSFACQWMPFKRCSWADGTFTLNKFECSNQADVA